MSLEVRAIGSPSCGGCHKCLSGKVAFVVMGAIEIPVTASVYGAPREPKL